MASPPSTEPGDGFDTGTTTRAAGAGPVVVMALMIALFVGMPDAAAETEDVHVLTAGGVDELQTVTVRYPLDAQPYLQSGPPTALSLSGGELATYTDVVVLPAGPLLLASSAGHEAVLFDADGQQIDHYADAADPTRSAVVAGYIGPDDPDLLLLSNDDPGRVRLFDTLIEDDVWTLPLIRQGESAHIARSIVLPGDRIATAARWPTLDLSAIEIASIDDAADVHRILWSRPHPETTTDDPIVGGMHPVRDVMADLDGRLLVASAHQVAIVDPDDGLQWKMTVDTDPSLGGEFESARWLDSGLIAVATRQPGLWNQPHLNHRLVLVDPDADAPVLDDISGFDAAPVALDSARGHGGTGTRHYDADALDTGGASPANLIVTQGPTLDPPDPRLDTQAALSVAITNEADDVVTIRRTEFRAVAVPCHEMDDADDFGPPWWSDDTRRDLYPGDEWAVDETHLNAEDLSVAAHCGQIAVVGRDGTRYELGDLVDFQIRSPDGHGPVIVDELAEHDDSGPHGNPGLPTNGDTQGCTCSSTPSSPSPLLIALVFLVVLRRVRSVTRV